MADFKDDELTNDQPVNNRTEIDFTGQGMMPSFPSSSLVKKLLKFALVVFMAGGLFLFIKSKGFFSKKTDDTTTMSTSDTPSGKYGYPSADQFKSKSSVVAKSSPKKKGMHAKAQKKSKTKTAKKTNKKSSKSSRFVSR